MDRQTRSVEVQVRDLVINRTFDAPRDLVWKAWTDPEALKRWWGPKSFSAPVIKSDFRVGGEYLFCMRSPQGKDYWSKGRYLEIVPQEKIVLSDSFADEKGNTVSASYYGMSSDFPLESIVTVSFFSETPGTTRLTLTYPGIPARQFGSAMAGWNETLAKLADYLHGRGRTRVTVESGRMDFAISREFDAPRELVFKAFTDPALYARWIGPRRLKTRVERFEPRPGGSWRYVQEDPQGNSYAFHGVFHEVTEPSRLIDTFEYEGLPESGHVSLEKATFEEAEPGRTVVNVQAVFLSVEDRDGMLQSGMEQGVNESHQRLDELLEELKGSRP